MRPGIRIPGTTLEDTLRKPTRRTAYSGLAIAAVGILLAGCAAAPEDDTDTGAEEATSDFLPCMISDTGGFDDKSFNQLGFEGLQGGAEALGSDYLEVESNTDADYAPNLDNLAAEGCNLIVTVGFNLAAATVEAANANPDINYSIIDDVADTDFDGTTDAENIKPIVFDTAQAAFLAGYAAASWSTSGIVGTFGGMNFPTVSVFMDGFAQGVAYHNEEKGTDVKVLGWDTAAQDGTFIGGFEPGTDALAAANNLIDQGADVLLPVGGPIYQSAGEAINAAMTANSDRKIAMIGVDADLYESDPTYSALYLTSILKGIDVAVADVVEAAGNDNFDNTPFLGTLENDAVGIAPFHDFEGEVSDTLQAELDEIKAGIIAGEITVASYLAG
ncbi:BMP family ABC transporter substrate-binding protein [Marisediminicola antarctica]|uniref:BMP family ABC transporter substrate-binding protein n=1 Tax=Marisediminicola antarctica TaxID=674079 RepID=A0A7L5ADN6_9MICO|nr:BMP family ABC transporter substrate-binding protein [Marisediminicola antarctica]